MAWAQGSGINSNQLSVSGNVITVTGGAVTIPAGTVLIVAVASDNTVSGDSETSLVSSITDSGTNTYTKIVEFTNGQAGAAAGATVSVWRSLLGTKIDPAGTVVVNFASSVAARAAAFSNFTIGAGNVVSVTSYVTNATDGAVAAAQTISSLANNEYLWLHCIATEGVITGTLTVTANYTKIIANNNYNAGTSGGGGAGNMSVGVEYRIFTGTNQTVQFTSQSADHAQVFIALREKAVGPVTTSPGAGTETYTGQTPAPFVLDPKTTQPDAGSETYTGAAPSVQESVVRNPGAGAIAYAGQAPSEVITLNVFTSPGAGAETYTGQAPTEAVTANQWVTPSAGTIAYAGQAPTEVVTANVFVPTAAGTVVYEGQAPALTAGDNKLTQPGAGSFVYAGQAPVFVLGDNQIVVPNAGEIIYGGLAPVVVITSVAEEEPVHGGTSRRDLRLKKVRRWSEPEVVYPIEIAETEPLEQAAYDLAEHEFDDELLIKVLALTVLH